MQIKRTGAGGAVSISFKSGGAAGSRLPLHRQPHVRAALAMATPRPMSAVYLPPPRPATPQNNNRGRR